MEGPDWLRISWSLPSVPGPLVGDGFLLRLWDRTRGQERRENVSSPQARTALLTGLMPDTHYLLDMRLYHCTLLGPASPHAHVLLPPSRMLEEGEGRRMRGGQGTHKTQKDMRGYRRLDGYGENPGHMENTGLGGPTASGRHGHGEDVGWTTGHVGAGEDLGHREDLEPQEDLA